MQKKQVSKQDKKKSKYGRRCDVVTKDLRDRLRLVPSFVVCHSEEHAFVQNIPYLHSLLVGCKKQPWSNHAFGQF
jgi:hypothetical protein